MITIYKGDDTGGLLGKSITIKFITEHDLSGCVIHFNYQGVERTFENVQSGDERQIYFSHNETARMSIGVFKAVIFAIDRSGKVRTITNAMPIKVSTNLAECYGDDEFEAHIGVAVEWSRITHKPFEGQTIDISTDDGIIAAVGTIIEHLGGQVA